MKQIIDIPVSYIKVETQKREVELPEAPVYYKTSDRRRLLAILPKYKNSPTHSYIIVCIERGEQKYTDFVIMDDPKQSAFRENYEGSTLRRTVLEIFLHGFHAFETTTKEEFERERIKLLDYYKKYE